MRPFFNKPKESFNKVLTFFNKSARNFYKILSFFSEKSGKIKGNYLCLGSSPLSYHKDTKFFAEIQIGINRR